MSKINALAGIVIRSPLLWGLSAFLGFVALVHSGALSQPVVLRYLAGHWVEYVEVAMFSVGLSAIALRFIGLLVQRSELGREHLGQAVEGGHLPSEAADMLDELPERSGAEGYLVGRLRSALEYVRRTGSADTLESHLKYLSDVDAGRAANSGGLVRFVVWAIPIMGFLGTVIGITVAIAELSPSQIENISGVVAGLGTAFDTTATALGLSMVLMFLQFLVDRSEQGLLAGVDAAAWDALIGRFQSDAGDPLAAVRLSDTMARAGERLLAAQAQAWERLETATRDRLAGVLDHAADAIRTSLDEGIQAWGDRLAESFDRVAAVREAGFESAAGRLAGVVDSLHQQRDVLLRQGEALERLADRAGEVASLERSLDSNLRAVASSGRFEETLSVLSAAVHLLAARAGHVVVEPLGADGGHAARVRSSGKAA